MAFLVAKQMTQAFFTFIPVQAQIGFEMSHLCVCVCSWQKWHYVNFSYNLKLWSSYKYCYAVFGILIPCYLRQKKMFLKWLKKPLFLTSERLKLEHNGQEPYSKLNSMMFLVWVSDRKYFPGTTIWGHSTEEVKLLWISSSFMQGIPMQKNFNYHVYLILFISLSA